MYRSHSKEFPLKDFESERRAKKDALGIIGSAIIFKLTYDDVPANLEDLVKKMLSTTSTIGSHLQQEVWAKLFEDAENFSNIIRGISHGKEETSSCWAVTFASLGCIKRRFISIATFQDPVNFGRDMNHISMFALVLSPSNEKETKSALETSLTLGSLLCDSFFRRNICDVNNSHDLKLLISDRVEKLITAQSQQNLLVKKESWKLINFMSGVKENFDRRLGYYWSDMVDGVQGPRTVAKVISTSFFLFFLCILPTLAFGVLNAKNTKGKIDANRALVGEAIGGLLFAFISGQPLVIIATTAPIALCNKIIYDISQDLDVEFYSLYACVGLFNSFFLILYGIFGLNSLIKFSTRSIEEIFSLFIVVCFTVDAYGDFIENIGETYFQLNTKSIPLLFFFLKNGTLILAVKLFGFKFSKFLSPSFRDTISDYALPIAVVIFSFVGSYGFQSVQVPVYPVDGHVEFTASDLSGLTPTAIGISLILGFTVSLLFFMDQGVSAQLVDSPVHHLKKGNANDLDLIVVAVINIFLSIFGLPWMHGLLPHSPLHVQALADYEERLVSGIPQRVITFVRETRLAAIFCHILIAIVVSFLPNVFSYIPVPVLDGLFVYCAVSRKHFCALEISMKRIIMECLFYRMGRVNKTIYKHIQHTYK